MSPAIIERVLAFARDPKRPRADDTTLAHLLIEVLGEVGISGRIPDESLAVLYGIAAELFDRVRNNLPAPTRCDADGRPVWSEQQIADTLGVPVEQVRARVEALEAEGVALRAGSETHVLN